MSYVYEQMRPALFTDEGQRNLLDVPDRVKALLTQAGAVRMQEAIRHTRASTNWDAMACVDRLVELGEIREITNSDTPGQYRVFVKIERNA